MRATVVEELLLVVVLVVLLVVPQTFGAPAPQVSPAGHVPQASGSRVRQVPFTIVPHSAPAASHVVGVQHTPLTRLPGGALLTHRPLWPFVPQQLVLVRQSVPSILHAEATASCCPTSSTIAAANKTPSSCLM